MPASLLADASFALNGGATPIDRRSARRYRSLWQHEIYGHRRQSPDAALAERERVIRRIRAHEAELRALGVTRLWLLGSLARGDTGRRSDVAAPGPGTTASASGCRLEARAHPNVATVARVAGLARWSWAALARALRRIGRPPPEPPRRARG